MKKSHLYSTLTNKCPRCREGALFTNTNPYDLSNILKMHDHCPVCGQLYDMEPGFWYGTGYVSYALAVAISTSTFVAWWVLIGVSSEDNRIFGWLIFNAFALLVLQPWMMRLSRVIYMRFFVRYDKDYEHTNPKAFE